MFDEAKASAERRPVHDTSEHSQPSQRSSQPPSDERHLSGQVTPTTPERASVRSMGAWAGSDCRAAPLRTVVLICCNLCAGSMRASSSATKLAHRVREQVCMHQTEQKLRVCVCMASAYACRKGKKSELHSRSSIANSACNRARHTNWRQRCSQNTAFPLKNARPCIDRQAT